MSDEERDMAVVGGGIVGLAVARELIRRHPRLSLTLLEQEARVGQHQTLHNSGVVHAGLYYEPGSLRARLCVEGAAMLYRYCEVNGIPHERCGKVVVATESNELPALEALERRGIANGVAGVRRIGARELERIEPHARGLAALHSPNTGIVDFPGVARALEHELLGLGAQIATSSGVTAATRQARSIGLIHSRGRLNARYAIFCAGHSADRLAVAAGAPADPRIVPFRGAYLRLRPERRALVRSLIYPVPAAGLPFLGVHLTRLVNGEVLIGPSALLVGARDAYRVGRIRRADLIATLGWPGTWRLARRHWRAGIGELRIAASRKAFVAAAARYVPDLGIDDVLAGPAGVRAQALGRDGALVDDFVFARTERALHLRNAPSPAATSSLAIAREVADKAELAFGLAR